MDKQKFILDVTAGYRMMWFNKQHPNTTYLDNREEVKPDIVGDFRDLKQFPDNTFKLIIFDPPHDIRPKLSNPNCKFAKSFGYLQTETWQADLKKGFNECWRVLEPYGILIFKWNTFSRRLKTVISLFPVKPLFGQISRGNKGKHSKHDSETYWLCYMKIPE